MTVLAIDPGTEQSAWVVWDGVRILAFGLEPNYEVRRRVLLASVELRAKHLAVEMIASYGMPVGAEVFETCVWIGRFVEVWGGEHTMVYRRHVKLELCGSPRAKDSNIRQALLDRVGPQGRKDAPGPTFGVRKDIWAALGVAVTWWDTLRE